MPCSARGSITREHVWSRGITCRLRFFHTFPLPLAHLGDLPELLALLKHVRLELFIELRIALGLLVLEEVPQDQDLRALEIGVDLDVASCPPSLLLYFPVIQIGPGVRGTCREDRPHHKTSIIDRIHHYIRDN